jgi:hypothetical protein
MSVQMTIQLSDQQGVQSVLQALESYKNRLRASIQHTRQNLNVFETRYGVPTIQFLSEMSAEDLQEADIEYVEWAGEAKLLEGLEAELNELEHARYQLS